MDWHSGTVSALLAALGALAYRQLFKGAKTSDGKGLFVQAVETGIAAFTATRHEMEQQTRLIHQLVQLHESQSSPFNNTVLEAAAVHAIDALMMLATQLEWQDALPHLKKSKELLEGKLKTPLNDLRK